MRFSKYYGEQWLSRNLTSIGKTTPPDQPSRSNDFSIVAPGKEKRRGKGGSLVNLQSLFNQLLTLSLVDRGTMFTG